MLNLKTTFKPSPNIVPRKTGDEYVLVPLSNNIADMDRVYTLNETGAFIWERLDGKTDLAAILKEMQKTFDVDKATAEQDLLEFIDQLKEYLIVSG